MIYIYCGTWIHQESGEVRWSYLEEDWRNAPRSRSGHRAGGTTWIAPLWASTDALGRHPCRENIWFFIDSEYVAKGIRCRSLRSQPKVSGAAAALLDSAWEALDKAAARHQIEWVWYDRSMVLSCYKVMQKTKRKAL